LGTTVELGLALLKLKAYVEDNHIAVPNSEAAVGLVRDYFSQTSPVNYLQESLIAAKQSGRADVVITLGRLTTLVEVKFSEPRRLRKSVEEAGKRLAKHLKASDFTQGAVIIFHRGKVPEKFQSVQKRNLILLRTRSKDIYQVVISLKPS
jgi:hypothetical protein